MAQAMGCWMARQAHFSARCPEGPDEDASTDRRGTGDIGEDPARVAMARPQSAQSLEHRLRKRHMAFLVALADDAQHAIGAVDGGDLESGGLGDAQAAGIDQREAGLMDGIADRTQQLANLAIR
jgi:hypothetical protein